jgi:hypothetical protein
MWCYSRSNDWWCHTACGTDGWLETTTAASIVHGAEGRILSMSVVAKTFARARDYLVRPILEHRSPVQVDVASQIQLAVTYRALLNSGQTLPALSDVGFKVSSQTDEDGILLYIFSIIGATSRTAVEICAGDGIECNTANLLLNHGWSGLLVDGNEMLVNRGREFYRRHPHTCVYPPTFVHAWITRDTINDLVRGHGFAGEVDLLSLDLDGVDYWIWQALDVIQPRVVVVEYQDIIGPDRALTVPYQDDFDASRYPSTLGMPNFCGASLLAFVKLARARGYRLVGCNRYGYNAFFIRNPLGEAAIPEIAVGDCFRHPKVLWGMKERFSSVRDLPWVEV